MICYNYIEIQLKNQLLLQLFYLNIEKGELEDPERQIRTPTSPIIFLNF